MTFSHIPLVGFFTMRIFDYVSATSSSTPIFFYERQKSISALATGMLSALPSLPKGDLIEFSS
jgi:hypothetical protein